MIAQNTSWPLIWDQSIKAFDQQAAIAKMKQARDRRPIMLAAIQNCQNTRRAKRLSRRYMRSASARLACLSAAAQRKFGSAQARDAHAVMLVEAQHLANPWARGVERMTAIPIEALDGSIKRHVFSVGIIDYASQLLAADIARVLTRPEPTQFMSAKGRPGFEEWLAEEISEAELVITTDIPACFDNVLRGVVDDGLPLPQRVREEVLYRSMDRALYLHRTHRGLAPIRERIAKVNSSKRGIPQGSAVSAIASEVVISRLIRAVQTASPDARMASYGDNLIILLRGISAKRSVIHALTSATEDCFGSDVISEFARRIHCGQPTKSFYFCGRVYRRKGSKLQVSLDLDRIEYAMIRRLIDINEAIRGEDFERLQKLDRGLRGWLREYQKSADAMEAAFDVISVIRSSRLWKEGTVGSK